MGRAAKQSSAGSHAASAGIVFDIDAQPLDRALEAFGAVTGQSVIYNSRLTEGRISRPVKGSYTPKAALDALIEGTGLMARYTAADALVLVQAPAGSANTMAPAAALQRYRGLVQSKIGETFCADTRLAAGDRRVAFRIWFDASGRVERAELLDSTGDRPFDSTVVDSLQRISMDEALPAGMTQPFTMLIMPRSSGQAWHCPEPGAGSSGHSPS